MKKILGLDIGVSSVGFALIEKGEQESRIIKTGVRIVNEDPSFHGNFYEGKTASKNAARTAKRSIRRNNQRFKLRRDKLAAILRKYNMYPDQDLLLSIPEEKLFELRHRALSEKLSLHEIGRILIHLNQKRGFLSNRKAQNKESDSDYLRRVSELGMLTESRTIGSFWHQFIRFKNNDMHAVDADLAEYFMQRIADFPDFRIRENIFPRRSYLAEFDSIWQAQQQYYPELLTGSPSSTVKENRKTLFHQIRNETIYFQRPLRSQKGLVSECSFEKHHKVCPRSSPLYQVFRIWQQINNLEVRSSEGEVYFPTEDDREAIYSALHDPKQLAKNGVLSYSRILKIMKFPARGFYLNFDQLEGNKTYLTLYTALENAGIKQPGGFLNFDALNNDEKTGLWLLWHITYSLESEDDVVNALMKHFGFDPDQSLLIAQKTGYTSDYGSLSARAIRKLLPHLIKGKNYYDACKEVGFENPEHVENKAVRDELRRTNPNTLRNPVVEQVLNQVANVVNSVIAVYGKPDEVRVEMARELKNNAKQRQRITRSNRDLRRYNELITERLKTEHGFKRVSNLDLLRYRLWEECNKKCLYSGKPISLAQVYNGETEIDHIIPISRSFNDAMSNKVLVFSKENKLKDQKTAFDYLKGKGETELQRFTSDVDLLFHEGYSALGKGKNETISKTKWQNLLCKGEEIPGDFIQRQLKDTQYIAKATIKLLKEVCPKVTTTSGAITDFLRADWGLNHMMQEINLEKFREVGRVGKRTVKDSGGDEKIIDQITDWSKRDDHRHHAVDALIIAHTSQGIIQKLNTLNQEYEHYKELKESALHFPLPMKDLRSEARKSIESILISFKKPNSKVLTRKINKFRSKGIDKQQETWVPRGSLHEDTVMGQMMWYKKVPLDKKFRVSWIDSIVDSGLREAIRAHLDFHKGKASAAFRETFEFKGKKVKEVSIWEEHFTKRVRLSETITPAQVTKIVDPKIRKKVEERIATAGSIKSAFKDYLKNPLFLDKGSSIPVKYVRVFDEGNLASLREGYVYTKGNHHMLIYEDDKGNYTDRVVSFWEAVETGLRNLKESGSIYPIIDRRDKAGLKFRFSLQINDLVVFDLNPEEVDFLNPLNYAMISTKLYRVQKMSSGDVFFRHHLETGLTNNESFALRRITAMNKLKEATKVKLNQLGQIIHLGE